MKKLIALVLFVTIVLSSLSAQVVRAAETTSEQPGLPYEIILESKFDPYEDPEPIAVRFFYPVEWESGKETDLSYVNPRNWQRTYTEEGSDRYVIECGGYLMEVTPKTVYGPVWMYSDYHSCGELVGVTANSFVFQEEGRWMAVYWGDFHEERRVFFEDLLEQERNTFKAVSESNIHQARSVQLESWHGKKFNWWISEDERTVYVDFPEWTVSRPGFVQLAEDANFDREYPYKGDALVWHQYAGGLDQTFFDQQVGEAPGYREAVFIGAIDGAAQIIEIPFEGDFISADAYKITYAREGNIYSKSLYPWYIDGEYVYPEFPHTIFTWGELDFPKELNGDSSMGTISMDKKPLF